MDHDLPFGDYMLEVDNILMERYGKRSSDVEYLSELQEGGLSVKEAAERMNDEGCVE